MKFATLKNDSRDGRLVVVSKDLSRYTIAEEHSNVETLQGLLDDWESQAPELEKVYAKLNSDSSFGAPFNADHPENCHAPLPRAYEWVDGSAYINHIVLVRKARGAEPPATLETDPLVYQGGSGVLLAPTQDIEFVDPSWGLDFEAEVVVYLADTPRGVSAKEAAKYIRLVGIVNDVSLRGLIPNELQKGFGFFNSKPASAFGPVVVTPEELGDKWKDGRLHLPMVSHLNGEKFGDPDSGPEMHFSFHDLVAHIAKSRAFTAGTILGSGTVSNEDRSRGSSCLAEKRMIEKIDTGEFTTEFMKPGDQIEIKVLGDDGKSVFGTIRQKVIQG